MAVIAGAGNPVGGSNPSGIGTSLNYIGEHAYAYSGIAEAATSPGTVFLEFNTGSSYIIATVQLYNTENESNIINWEIEINGTKVIEYNQEGRVALPFHVPEGNKIIVPSYSSVVVRGIALSSATDGAAMFTGRVYA